ncbi:hypothetical protein MUDAN_DOGOELCO_02550 [Lactiplantibacillus mudanjiangensis]|nr:hypothetical protein MUDAN_DOGOELCO_02550 [Lactiplantibacillus mudanjiangensis]
MLNQKWMVRMTKQRKHTKKSTMRKKKRRMRQHAMEHSKTEQGRSNLHSAPYVVTKDWSDG